MLKKLYIYVLLITTTFTMSCSYSGTEDPGDTFRVLAASKDSYEVVLGGTVYAELPSGLIYGYDDFGKKIIIGHYVSGVEGTYTRAIYANGYNESSQTYFNYFGVELILDENDNQQAVGMEFYYNDGEYYYNQADIQFTDEKRATFLRNFKSPTTQVSNDKYMVSTGLSITTTKSGTLYSVATIKNADDNESFIKGYVLDNKTIISEEIKMGTATPTNLKTTGYHSIAPFSDNATLTYIMENEKVEVFEINNKLIRGRTLTEDTGLGSNAVYSTIATNKDQDIFVAYVDKDDKLTMYKKDNGTVDEVASFVDYFNGGKIENVSQPIIKIFDNGTVITSYIDNSSKLLKIIVDDFINSASLDFITIIPPTNLEVTSFSVDIIEDTLHYIYSTPMGSEISVYENGLWRVIKNYTIYNNSDFVSIGGVNKKELYFMFSYNYKHQQCNGLDNDTECQEGGDAIVQINTMDYIMLYGFQSKEGAVSATPNIGSFAHFNGVGYYLYNNEQGLRIAETMKDRFNPRPPSTADGLPMVRNGSGIDIFELVNNSTDIDESDELHDTEYAR